MLYNYACTVVYFNELVLKRDCAAACMGMLLLEDVPIAEMMYVHVALVMISESSVAVNVNYGHACIHIPIFVAQ